MGRVHWDWENRKYYKMSYTTLKKPYKLQIVIELMPDQFIHRFLGTWPKFFSLSTVEQAPQVGSARVYDEGKEAESWRSRIFM